MGDPIKGKNVSTPYGQRGPYWSCNEDPAGDGIHTGCDVGGVPAGTDVLAMRPGKVRHVNYGSGFGSKQVAVQMADGSSEDFYAHMRSRVSHGATVKLGDKIGEVGSEGNASGPHLHVERHPDPGYWNCHNLDDPQKSINYEEDPFMGMSADDIGKAVAKHTWKDDIVPSGFPDNPEWSAGSFLKEIYGVLRNVAADVEEIKQKVI